MKSSMRINKILIELRISLKKKSRSTSHCRIWRKRTILDFSLSKVISWWLTVLCRNPFSSEVKSPTKFSSRSQPRLHGITNEKVSWWSKTITETKKTVNRSTKTLSRKFKKKSTTLMSKNLNISICVRSNFALTNKNSNWRRNWPNQRTTVCLSKSISTISEPTSGQMSIVGFTHHVTSLHNLFGLKSTRLSRVAPTLIYFRDSTCHKKSISLPHQTLSWPRRKNLTFMRSSASMKDGKSSLVPMILWMLWTMILIISDLEAILDLKFTISWLMKFKICLMPLSICCPRLRAMVCFILGIQLRLLPRVLGSGSVISRVSLTLESWIIHCCLKDPSSNIWLSTFGLTTISFSWQIQLFHQSKSFSLKLSINLLKKGQILMDLNRWFWHKMMKKCCFTFFAVRTSRNKFKMATAWKSLHCSSVVIKLSLFGTSKVNRESQTCFNTHYA